MGIPVFTPVFSNTSYGVDSSTFINTGGGGGSYNAYAGSTQAYVNGVYATAKTTANTIDVTFGLTTSSLSTTQDDLDYSFRFDSAGDVKIYELGTQVGSTFGYNSNKTFYITYDGYNVRYYDGPTLLATTARAIGNPLAFNSIYYTSNEGFTNVGFGPMGEAGTNGTSGNTGATGTSGTSGTRGSSGSSGANGTLTLTGTTNNGVITLNGTAPNATVESKLTFDGSTLNINGVTINSGSNAGTNNIAIGERALNATLNTGSDNIAIGYQALFTNNKGTRNIAIGSNALYSLASVVDGFPSDNIAIGVDALKSNTQGSTNIAIGNSASANLPNSEGYSIAIGIGALENATEGSSIGIGFLSLRANPGLNNLGVGGNTLQNLTVGSANTAIGNGAGNNLSEGSNNTFVGYNAGKGDTIGYTSTSEGSVAIGYNSLYGGGSFNTVVGTYTLLNNTTGVRNVAIGYNNSPSNSVGSDNISIGASTNSNNISGSRNISIGNAALNLNRTGNNNTVLGYQAGIATSGSNNTYIGLEAGELITTGNNNTFLGAYQGAIGPLTSTIAISDGLGNVHIYATGSRVAINKIANPNATLDVNGNTLITGSLTVTGNIVNNLGMGFVSCSLLVSGSSTAQRAFSASFKNVDGTSIPRAQLIHWWTSATQTGSASTPTAGAGPVTYLVVSGSNIVPISNSGSINHAVTDNNGNFAVRLTGTTGGTVQTIWFNTEVQGIIYSTSTTITAGIA
jgi:hypothetical protein